MANRIFESMSSSKMAGLISNSEKRVIVVSPGIQKNVAQALAAAIERLSSKAVRVILDGNEDVCRLGYGDIEAIKILQAAGSDIRHVAGLRSGVLVCDDDVWIFTPVALYVQEEIQSDETPNALHLGKDVADMIAVRTSEEERSKVADELSLNPVEIELGAFPLRKEETVKIEQALEQIPPVPFDVARQVRVFESYLQYVEMRLDGCRLERHRVKIPDEIAGLGANEDIVERIHTTFDLINRDTALSSAELNTKLQDIRDEFSPSLGKPWGRVMLM